MGKYNVILLNYYIVNNNQKNNFFSSEQLYIETCKFNNLLSNALFNYYNLLNLYNINFIPFFLFKNRKNTNVKIVKKIFKKINPNLIIISKFSTVLKHGKIKYPGCDLFYNNPISRKIASTISGYIQQYYNVRNVIKSKKIKIKYPTIVINLCYINDNYSRQYFNTLKDRFARALATAIKDYFHKKILEKQDYLWMYPDPNYC